ncbi:MAG: FtsW/RodA/SpoVE family cell cycle protein, partial [Verrucomicrobiia bacterium]
MLTLTQKLARFHWLSAILMYALLAAGVILIYSATHLSDRPEIQSSVNQQLIAIAAGSVAFFVLALTRYQTLLDYAPWILGLSLLSLVAVLLFGRTVYGAKSWLSLGFASVQPAEFAKLAFICAFAWFLVHFRDRVNSPRILLLSALLAALPLSLILAQPDTGTALVFGPIIFFMMMVAGLRWLYLILPIAGAALALFTSYTIVYFGQWDGTLQDLPGSIREGLLIETGQIERPLRFEERAQAQATAEAEARARGEPPPASARS